MVSAATSNQQPIEPINQHLRLCSKIIDALARNAPQSIDELKQSTQAECNTDLINALFELQKNNVVHNINEPTLDQLAEAMSASNGDCANAIKELANRARPVKFQLTQ